MTATYFTFRVFLFFLSCGILAFSQPPVPPLLQCAHAPAHPAPAQIVVSQPLQPAQDDHFLFLLYPATPVKIGVRFDAQGKVACVMPLSARSWQWRSAIDAILQSGAFPHKSGQHAVFVFHSPTPSRHSGPPPQPECLSNATREENLALGLVFLHGREHKKAEACFLLVLKSHPQSVAALYGAAVASHLLGRPKVASTFYEKVLALRPDFFDASLVLGKIQVELGSTDALKITLWRALDSDPPLPIRKSANSSLVFFHDEQNRRKEGMEALKAEIAASKSLHQWDVTLAPAWEIAFRYSDLGLRLEELGLHAEAKAAYMEFSSWEKKTDKMHEASRFRAELGQSRSLRKLNQFAAAENICSTWHSRLRRHSHRLKGHSWGDKKSVLAEWELSCGNKESGLAMVRQVISDQPSNPFPHEVLERYYRANQDPGSAALAYQNSDRIRTANDARILQGIAEEVRNPK